MLYAIQKTCIQLFHKNKFMSGERENDRMKNVAGLWNEIHLGTIHGSAKYAVSGKLFNLFA